MVGLGTLINMGLIVVGGLVGMVGGRFITPRIQDGLMKAAAVCVMFVGLAGAMQQMLAVSGAGLTSGGTMRMLISLAGGTVIGEAANLERWMEHFGEWLKAKTGNARDDGFVNAFVTCSLTVCIGAMAVVGAIQDGVAGDWSTLALKGALDCVIVCVMSASLGRGAIFSAIPVGIFQGAITLAAHALEGVMTTAAVNGLSMVGAILIFCVGVNLIWPKTFRVANMLPSVFIAALLAFV